jgi:hypothetical protein
MKTPPKVQVGWHMPEDGAGSLIEPGDVRCE